MTIQDVTPEGSVAPVYLDPTPREPADEPFDLEAEEAAKQALRASAVAKLMALDLTEEEALALAGG